MIPDASSRARRRRDRFPLRDAAVLAFLALILIPSVNRAAEAPSAGPPRVEVPTVEEAPVLDGRLAPGEWEGAATFELGFQIDPGDDTAPGERTEVFVMRSADTLYLAFHAHDGEPGAIRARVTRRDDLFDDDYVAVYLDTYDDRQRAYALFFNPLGNQADGIYTEAQSGIASRRYEDSVDLTWDGIFESAGAVGEDGYVVEAAIPFRSLRFASGEGKSWGLHVQRWIARKAERDSWTPIRRDVSGLLVQMGSLGGLEEIYIGRSADLIPTLTLSRSGDLTDEGGLHYVNRIAPGLSVNWALAPHLVLSGAVNPDFSQVESDVPQIVVNQRFPLFYPEKRPFFLEGAEVFLPAQPSGAAIMMVDTRAIVDPDWGVKLTGKLGHFGIGLLTASDNAPGLRVPPGDPDFERNAQFTILRLRRDVGEDSAFGFFANAWSFSGASNNVLEADGRFRLTGSATFAVQAGGSRTEDEAGGRRDGGFTLARMTFDGKRWKWILSDKYISDGYVNEAGFIRRTGIHSDLGRLAYDYRPADQSRLSALQPYVLGNYQRNSLGFLDESYAGGGLDAVFPDGITASFSAIREWEYFSGTGLRYQYAQVGADVERFKRFSFSAYVQVGGAVNYDPANPVVGDQLQISADATVKPNDRFSSEFLYLKARLTDRKTGEQFYDQDIVRNRSLYQFTRNTAARVILEYDSFLRQFSSSLLASYTPHPNTAIYVGYGEIGLHDLDPILGEPAPGYFPTQRTFFMKLSYDFRVQASRAHEESPSPPRGGRFAAGARPVPRGAVLAAP